MIGVSLMADVVVQMKQYGGSSMGKAVWKTRLENNRAWSPVHVHLWGNEKKLSKWSELWVQMLTYQL